MPQVLDRENPTQAPESAVTSPERPALGEPPIIEAPGRRVRWIAWIVALMTVALAGVFVYDLVGDETATPGDELTAVTSDGSYEANEFRRMLDLAPTAVTSDGSYEANELRRMLDLAPDDEQSDGSWEVAELRRMLELAPEETGG